MRALILLAALVAAAPAWAQSRGERIEMLEAQVAALEQQLAGQGLLEMSRRIDALQEENRRLRGDLERLQFEVEQLRRQQRDQYLDLDRRLQVQETQPAVATVSLDPQASYQAAFDLLKAGQYDQAAADFRTFLDLFPQHELASNAQYWLGEVYYVKRDWPAAATAFQAVLDRYPEARKTPDALLKLGFVQAEQRQPALARATLEKVVAQFPETSAAAEAEQRLRRLAAEGR